MQEQIKGDRSMGPLAKDKIMLTLPNTPEYVSVARLTLSGIANRMGFDVEAIEDLKVAIAEACTNALKHGCGEDCDYTIEFSVFNNRLDIEIIDKGEGFDYKNLVEPDLTKPREGGLGIFIIKSLMDDVEINNYKGRGTRILMRKNLGEA
jgi:serine/threonine-protein kinase RsbW